MIEIQVRNGQPVIVDGEDSELIRQAKLRAERNALLSECDIYMVEDYPITIEKKEEWKSYRQALRDMNFSDVDNIVWPTKPE